MERVEVELFTDGSNNAVIRMPGRNFSGVLTQGDSLSVIRSDVADIRDACRTEGATEALELAESSPGRDHAALYRRSRTSRAAQAVLITGTSSPNTQRP
jgi:hypothetical protein